MGVLILLRHGESTWNKENRFTGWVDVDLTSDGEREASEAGTLIAAEPGLDVDTLHTSVLTRAVRTANLCLDALEHSYLPVRRHWRLNERHYGALTGQNKLEAAEHFGKDQVKRWRRGYRTPPEPVQPDSPFHPANDPRYASVPRWALPATECLADVVDRMTPYFADAIVPELLGGQTVLVVAHGNSLRALVKVIEDLSDEAIVEFEFPTGIPRVYELGNGLEVRDVRFLGDAEAISAKAEATALQAG